ncbi:MAG: protein-L-isoaspartate O-methyltransferase family protein [Rhodoferax sp.]
MNLSNVAQARFNMIEQQIRPWNVLDTEILDLLAEVPREAFVPETQRALAFADLEISLGHGESMLAPRIQARLLQDLQVQSHERVLEIGTGSGYLSALLAHRAASVLSLEIQPELAAVARANLQRAGLHNVEVRVADGAKPLRGEGPFDAIVLGGSVAEVPPHLLDMLAVGGRLISIVGDEPIMSATLVTRVGPADLRSTKLWDANAARLHGFAEHSSFHF